MIAVPMAGGAAAMLGKIFPRAGRAVSVVAVLAVLSPALFTVPFLSPVLAGQQINYALGGWPEPYGISLVLDGFAWITVLLISVVSFLSGLFSLGSSKYSPLYYLFLSLLAAGLTGVALTGDLFTMFVCFEIVAIAAYVLIVYEKNPTGLVAGFKYLVLSSVGILFFLFGVFLVYRELGVLSLNKIHAALESSGGTASSRAIHFALASLCVGIGVRTAFIPFHTWLPEAHAYAPHPVSALLSGVLIKVSFFAMVRILAAFNGEYLYSLLLWVGALTALVAVFYALAQKDAKRLLAYHSVSQMGYILAAYGTGTTLGLAAAFVHALNHALFKSLLFLTVGAAVERTGVRNLYAMRPLGREMPLTAAAFFIGAASIAGLPPFNGFISKTLISAAMKGSPAYYLLWITGFMTLASFIKLSRIYLPGPAATGREARYRFSMPVAASLLGLAILCLAGGIAGIFLTRKIFALLTGGGTLAYSGFWTVKKLSALLPVVLLGTGTFSGLKTTSGQRVAAYLRG